MIEKWVKVSDLANALGKSEEDSAELLEIMHALGLPRPRPDTADLSASQVLDWVLRQQELMLDIVAMIQEKTC